MAGPLNGIRVIDFTRVVAGPQCTMIMGDLGAEVIKVERPQGGDDARAFGPPFRNGESIYFLGFNRNKKSVVIDLGTEAGRAQARRLIDTADVVIENFRSGYMRSIGLDHESVSAAHPGLIYCSITGYGEDGPYRDRAGYDVMVSALGGMMGITGLPGQPPVKTGVAVLDTATGMYALIGILAALHHRDLTGQGQRISVSLLESQVAQLINAAHLYLNAGEVMGPQGHTHTSIVPYQAFRCADGYLLVGGANDKMFRGICRALGHPEWASDPAYATNPARVENREQLVALLEAVFEKDTVGAWVERLVAEGVAAAPVNRVDQVFADPQVVHNQQVRTVEHPAAGEIRLVGSPLHLSLTPVVDPQPPPLLGQHTAEILDDLERRHPA